MTCSICHAPYELRRSGETAGRFVWLPTCGHTAAYATDDLAAARARHPSNCGRSPAAHPSPVAASDGVPAVGDDGARRSALPVSGKSAPDACSSSTAGNIAAAGLARATERFWKYAEITDTCWLWRGQISVKGYGYISVRRQTSPKGYVPRQKRFAHRFAYELLVGPIPDGLQIDHLCRVRHCVNPAHLEPVTGAENLRRGLKGPRTHCKRGHLYTPENTRIRISEGRPYRICRICQAENAARRRGPERRVPRDVSPPTAGEPAAPKAVGTAMRAVPTVTA